MNASKKSRPSKDERRAQVAEIRAAQVRADRRRKALTILVFGAIVLALAIPTTIVIINAQRDAVAVEQAASQPIEGEKVVDIPSATHVARDIPYETASAAADGTLLPPTGGDHDPVVQNCGYYAEPIRSENALHSLEHGAVWVTYRPGLDDAQVATLRDLAEANPYMLVSPFKDLASDVVATAWGVQVELDSAQDERLEPFLQRYLQGEQTPEPGAPCQGGIGA
ncbi:MAG: hypothetical protein CVT68_00310 [Actinobacteria bacterium HGW-Actinobacteria-8]|nr:MAG: hypothetical protein CVT68_00310 [Actinobacteria bacterium HGW-Actinobacteria-8]